MCGHRGIQFPNGSARLPAYTLIELLVTIAIIVVLVALFCQPLELQESPADV